MALLVLIAGVTALGKLPPVRTATFEPVHLAAVDALIMTGTDMHVVDQAWMDIATDHYIQPALGGDYVPYPLSTPEEFWPFGGITDRVFDVSVRQGLADLDTAIAAMQAAHSAAGHPDAPTLVFGYSQSAIIATLEKRKLAAAADAGTPVPPVAFVIIGNPNRPNGGLNARFPGLVLPGWTFSGPTPTNTPFQTVDVARQYDFFADFPRYPLNLLADLNSVMGLYTHNYTMTTLNPADPAYDPNTVVQQVGDTTYYLVPTEHLPLLQPLRDIGIGVRLADAVEPTLRVLVELGYDRTTPYGQPAPAEAFPAIDITKLESDLAAAVREGIASLTAPIPPAQRPPAAVEPGTSTTNELARSARRAVHASTISRAYSPSSKQPTARTPQRRGVSLPTKHAT